MRKLAKWVAAAAVVTILSIGTISPAYADILPPPPGEPVSAKLAANFSKWRQYMLTMPGSMFKWAFDSPSPVDPGQLAHKSELAAQRFGFRNVVPASAEGLNYLNNTPAVQYIHDANGNAVAYQVLDRNGGDDAKVLRGIEAQTQKADKRRWFTGARPAKVQPTKAARLGKLVNGAFVGLLAAEFAPVLDHTVANTIGGWLGQDDAMGEFCTSEVMRDQGAAGELLWQTFNVVTGLPCSSDMYQPQTEYFEGEGQMTSCLTPNLEPTLTKASCVVLDKEIKFSTYTVQCFVADFTGSTPVAGWMLKRRWVPATSAPQSANIGNSGTTPCYAWPVPDSLNKYHTYNYMSASTGSMELYFERISDGFKTDWTSQAEARDVVLECVVTLTDGRTLRSEGVATSSEGGQVSPPACPAVPEGATVENVRIGEKGGDTLYDEDSAPEYLEWRQNDPDCSAGTCLLDLRKKVSATASVSCFDLEDGCVDWFDESNREDTYYCFYNDRKVDLAECFVYAGLFTPGRVEVGAPYSDPMTGIWSGGQSSPRPDRDAMGQTIQSPGAPRSCTGLNVSGFDPVGFVMRPIQCALEWAFVPRPLVVEAELVGGEKAWENKPPKVIADAVSGFSLAPSVSGCSRSVTIFSGDFASTITPMNACPGSWGETAANVSRVATAAAMVVLVVVVVRRQIAGMIGYGAGQ